VTDILSAYDAELWGPEEAAWDQLDSATPASGVPANAEDAEALREALINKQAERRALWHEADRRGRQLAIEREAARNRIEPPQPINWGAFLAEDIKPPEFFAGKLLGHDQHGAMVGAGKAGKSLFVLDMSYRIASGQTFLGDRARKPQRVLYVDQENSRYDIQSRLRSFGAKPSELDNLIYMSFPAFRPLDTPAGAMDLIDEVDRHRPDLVVLDTISRMIQGKENDSDPWRDMYRLFIVEMKRRRIASFRLDHFGKDATKGGRGSSAKDQDVDAVWELAPVEKGANLLSLTRTHTRNGIGPSSFTIERQGDLVADQWRPGSTRHVLAEISDEPQPEFIIAGMIADQLDAAGVPQGLSRDKVRALIKVKHPEIRCNNDMLGAALKVRRDRLGLPEVA
jgi:hypothetical protein